MAIPKQVLEAEEKANQMLEEATATQNEVVEAEPIASDAASKVETNEDEQLKAQEQELSKQLALHRQRNATLQGMIDAETARNQALRESFAEVRKPQPSEPQKPGYLKHLKPEEVEDYGKEAVDLQARIARGEAEEVTNEIKKRMEDLEASLRSEKTVVAANDLWSRIETKIPGAKAMDSTDTGWHAWLQGVDEDSGEIRRELAGAAFQRKDVKSVVAMMNEYKAESGSGPTPLVAAQRKPDRVRAERAGQVTEKQPITTATVKKFYEDLNRGKFKGREAEAARIEQEIDEAHAAGMIRG